MLGALRFSLIHSLFILMDHATLAGKDAQKTAADALRANGIEPIIVEKGSDALAKIKELIPGGASVMTGSSQTLEVIGLLYHLKEGKHGWNNLKDAILAEKDPAQQAALRKSSVLSDYYLGSVHALSETGELVIASASGSQLPHIVFTSPNIIFVVGAQKIVPTLADALRRVEEYVFPLEDARMKETGAPGSVLAKILIFKKEPAFMGRKVRLVIVNEPLGF